MWLRDCVVVPEVLAPVKICWVF